MLDIVKRLREPVAVVVLVALALRLVGGVVTLLLPAARGGYGSLESASRWAAQTFTDPLTAVVLVLLVGACLAWEPTPRARLLAQLGVAVIGIGAVLSLVFAVVGIAGNDDIVWVPELLLVLVRLVIPLLAGVVMYRLLAGSTEHRTAVPAVTQSPSSAEPDKTKELQPPDQPTWQPDQAAGAVWTTAGEAATGAAAASWGTPGQAGGWTPISGGPGTPSAAGSAGSPVGEPESADPPGHQRAEPGDGSSPRSSW